MVAIFSLNACNIFVVFCANFVSMNVFCYFLYQLLHDKSGISSIFAENN